MRIRISVARLSQVGPVPTWLSPNGSWSEKTPDPAFSLNLDYWKHIEDRKLQARKQVVLGNQGHATGRHGRYWISTPSQLGGLPQWIQEPDYPHCPSCRQRMIYLEAILSRM